MNEQYPVLETEKLFQLMLSKDDSYSDDAKLFVKFLKEHNFGISLEGFQAYADFLNAEKEGKRLSANTFNKRILGAKNRLKYIFQNSPESFNVLKVFQFDKALQSVKLKKINSSAVPDDNVLSEEEITKLITESEDKTIALMIEFLFTTGLRISEMLGILQSDVKKNNGKYIVTVLGKKNKERRVYVPNDLVFRVKDFFRGNKYLFEHNGKQYNRIAVTNRITLQGKIILGRRISAHTLRHSWATITLKKTNNLKGVSKYLGHSSTSTTANLYIHDELTWEDINQ